MSDAKANDNKKYIIMTNISGYIAGFAQKFLTHPIDTVKTKKQVINQL